jgi:hypothetical protein
MFKVSINSISRVTIKDSTHQNTQTVERCSLSAANLDAQQVASYGMTLCHDVSGSRRFGVSLPSRANSLLGPPDREERTPQLQPSENPRTCTCNLPREGQGRRLKYSSCHKQEMTCSVDTVASLARAGRRYIYLGLHQ